MKTVLLFDPISRAGGGLSYLSNAINVFCKSDKYRYIFYCNYSLKERLEKNNPEADFIFSSPISAKGGVIGLINRFINSKKIIDRIAPDAVIYMNQIPSSIKIKSALFLRNALYFIPIDPLYKGKISFFWWLYSLFFRYITKRSINRADVVVTSSASFSQTVKTVYKSQKEFTVAPFGINTSTISKKRSISEKKNLLFLHYNFYKGLDIVLAALTILKKKFPDVKLTITDNLNNYNDGMAKHLLKTIGTKSLSEHIEMTGLLPQKDLAAIYNRSEIFLFPSFVESFGQGLIEAMANGLPCVVSDLPVFRELAGDSALYFETGNPESLAEKIEMVFVNSGLRKTLSDKAIVAARQYSWQNHVNKIEEIISEII